MIGPFANYPGLVASTSKSGTTETTGTTEQTFPWLWVSLIILVVLAAAGFFLLKKR